MNRNICIINKQPVLLNNFDNILYFDIDNIVNYSVNNLVCQILETINKETANVLLNKLFDKIRLGGKIVITVSNIDFLAKQFITGVLDGALFLSNIKNIENIITKTDLDHIINLNPKFRLIQSDITGAQSTIVMERREL